MIAPSLIVCCLYVLYDGIALYLPVALFCPLCTVLHLVCGGDSAPLSHCTSHSLHCRFILVYLVFPCTFIITTTVQRTRCVGHSTVGVPGVTRLTLPLPLRGSHFRYAPHTCHTLTYVVVVAVNPVPRLMYIRAHLRIQVFPLLLLAITHERRRRKKALPRFTRRAFIGVTNTHHARVRTAARALLPRHSPQPVPHIDGVPRSVLLLHLHLHVGCISPQVGSSALPARSAFPHHDTFCVTVTLPSTFHSGTYVDVTRLSTFGYG